MTHNDKDPKSPQNKLISFMERKSELLGAKNKLFTAEDADEILSWTDQEAEEVITQIIEKDFTWDTNICPWCLFYDLECLGCTFAQRHRICDQALNNTYGKVLEQILPDSFVDHLTPHKAELLALLRGEREKQK